VLDNSSSPGFVPAGSSNSGVVSSGSPSHLLTALTSFLDSFLGSSPPPLRQVVKGPSYRNPSGILDWRPTSRCLSGPLGGSAAAPTFIWSVGHFHRAWHLCKFEVDRCLTLWLPTSSAPKHCHRINFTYAVMARPLSA
jgi:hypothetical protein